MHERQQLELLEQAAALIREQLDYYQRLAEGSKHLTKGHRGSPLQERRVEALELALSVIAMRRVVLEAQLNRPPTPNPRAPFLAAMAEADEEEREDASGNKAPEA